MDSIMGEASGSSETQSIIDPKSILHENQSVTSPSSVLHENESVTNPNPVLNENQSVADPKSTLHKLPSEIRKEVFVQCVDSDGNVPALILATKQDPMLYDEAMEVFLESQYFVVYYVHGWAFRGLNVDWASKIKKLELTVNLSRYRNPTRYQNELLRAEEVIASVPNLREIRLNCTSPESCSLDHVFVFELIYVFLSNSENLEKCSVALPVFGDQTHHTELAYEVSHGELINNINARLETTGKLADVREDLGRQELNKYHYRGSQKVLRQYKWIRRAETWFWQVEKGKVLDLVEL